MAPWAPPAGDDLLLYGCRMPAFLESMATLWLPLWLPWLLQMLGADGAQNLGPDIIGALPAGNQKSALFKIFSTTG